MKERLKNATSKVGYGLVNIVGHAIGYTLGYALGIAKIIKIRSVIKEQRKRAIGLGLSTEEIEIYGRKVVDFVHEQEAQEGKVDWDSVREYADEEINKIIY